MLKYQNISTSILEFLRRQIVSGKIQGGERLIENKLSVELGVSRPPLRETFRILQNESLVRTIPRIGTFVTELSSSDFNQICDLRIMVECFAVQQLKSIEKKELPELEKIVETQNLVQIPKKFIDDEQKYSLFWKFANFHLQLVESANNSYLTHWYRGLSSNIARYQYLFFFQPGAIAKDLKDHTKMLALIQSGQLDEAENLLKAHLEYQRIKLMKTLSRVEKANINVKAH
ncbi:GntR family transcriptional regulator [uncultured Desulfobacter sp.]|uniref:GntR family transcriptional regulator n=1 Tax=uncultured Desulfobacter sp. TaxID=240139 RepID=UPI0029F52B09|nr:GntR family transcriptional regulator [uncultured Desulfobacter sp.]